MEDIRQKRKARSKSSVSRQAGFTIDDNTNHDSETEVTEVAFLNRALKEAITQGASYIHIEPADDGVAVRYRVDGEYQEFARETRDVSAVMKRLRVLAGLPVVPVCGARHPGRKAAHASPETPRPSASQPHAPASYRAGVAARGHRSCARADSPRFLREDIRTPRHSLPRRHPRSGCGK